MMLIVSPIALRATMEVRIARGIEVAMITVLRQLPEKSEDHEGGQTRCNQCFPDDSADGATNENRLIRQRRNI